MDTQNLTGGRLSPLLYQEYDKAGVCNQGGMELSSNSTPVSSVPPTSHGLQNVEFRMHSLKSRRIPSWFITPSTSSSAQLSAKSSSDSVSEATGSERIEITHIDRLLQLVKDASSSSSSSSSSSYIAVDSFLWVLTDEQAVINFANKLKAQGIEKSPELVELLSRRFGECAANACSIRHAPKSDAFAFFFRPNEWQRKKP